MDKTKIYLFGGIGTVAIFVLLLIMGIIPGLQTASDKGANLVMWGFEDQKKVWEPTLNAFQKIYPKIKIQYIQKNPNAFENDLVNTIAIGVQIPDIVVFPSDYFRKQLDKLSAAPVGLVTERQMKDSYIDAALMFWSQSAQTVAGLPLYGDALVLYSNKGLLTKHFFVRPPQTWDEFLDYSQKITEKDSAGNIIIAGSAMGRANNINNASQIITALFLQFGDDIVSPDGAISFGKATTQGSIQANPAESALQFFNNFANPKKSTYSWSFALPEAEDMFVRGKLGLYIGLMSEYEKLRAKNPHLDIQVSLLPQLTNAPRPITGGRLYLLAVPRASRQQTVSWATIAYLTGPEGGQVFANNMKTVLPRRDVFPSYQNEAVRSVFANSMLALKLWKIPDPVPTKNIFNTMIEDLAFGRGSVFDVIRNANTKLNNL
ncbi:MAG: extracellular solute-binding protein [Patescibacteria group bacterium]